MLPGLLEILRCPSCMGALRLRGDERAKDGAIVSAALDCDCGQTYPVVSGIPRFVPREGYASSFGLQWTRFASTQLDRRNGTRLSEGRLLAETDEPREWWPGKRVVDIGCGAGRFLDVAARLGAEAVGVDYSVAVDAAAESLRDGPAVDLVQADIYALPFAPGTFDLAYCIGVVQHTPDPIVALARLPAPVRTGGRVAMTSYERRRATPLFSKYLLRRLLRRMGDRRKLRVIESVMPLAFPLTDILFRLPVIGRLMRFAIPIANYVDIPELTRKQRYEWALLDTFDMLAPTYDRPLTEEEARSGLRSGGLAEIRRLGNPGLNLVGTKT